MADIASAIAIEVMESKNFTWQVYSTTQPERDGETWRSPGSKHPLKFKNGDVFYAFYTHPNGYSQLKGTSPHTSVARKQGHDGELLQIFRPNDDT